MADSLITVNKSDFSKNPPDAAIVAKSLQDTGNLSSDPAVAKQQIQSTVNEYQNTLSGKTQKVNVNNTSTSDTVQQQQTIGVNKNIQQTKYNGGFAGKLSNKNVGSIDHLSLYHVNIVDVDTHKKIPIYSIMDPIRLARGGQGYTSVVGTQMIPSDKDLISQFVRTSKYYSPWNCVNALGVYNTEYIRHRVYKYTNSNYALDDIEDDYVRDDLVFRGYVKGGASPRKNDGTPKQTVELIGEGSDKLIDAKEVRRRSELLGIGVGECAVLNPPFQFNKRDDVRTNPIYPKIGRVYSTQLMNNWPIVLFQPGRLKYNTGFFKMLGLGMGAGATESLIRTGGDGIIGAFSKLVNVVSDVFGVIGTIGSAIFGGSKVVEFKQSIMLYRQYLNFLLEDMAGIMGLTDIHGYHGSVNKLMLEKILPISYMNGGISNYINSQFIPFRCNKDVGSNETFNNSMTENPLMEKFNSIAQENDEANGSESDPTTGFKEKALKAVKKAGMRFAGSFSEQALVLSGRGRISLPEVFSSSSFSRSFSLEIKLHSPYGDPLSQFENEYMQLMFLLAMGVPRQTGKLSYTSPFAVRVFVKNHIMINCGMIESLSVTRGGDSNDWCPNGYPKTMTVSVNVKDCEPNITLPLASRGSIKAGLEVMFPSTGMSEYLASIGGLPIDQITHNWRKEHLRRAAAVTVNGWSKWWDRDSTWMNIANSRIGSSLFGLIKGNDADVLNKLGDNVSYDAKTMFNNNAKQIWASPGQGLHSIALNGTPEGYSIQDSENKENAAALADLNKSLSDSYYD